MELDYLEEIKIERKPGTRRVPGRGRISRSSGITLDSVKSRKATIESLRQQGKQVDEEGPSLSAANIELLKNRIKAERNLRPSRLIPDGMADSVSISLPPVQESAAPVMDVSVPVQEATSLVMETASPVMDAAPHVKEAPASVQEISSAEPIPQVSEISRPVENETPLSPEKSPVPESEPSSVQEAVSRSERRLGTHVMLRYIVRELFFYFAICFAFFFVVFFVNNILVLAETVLRQRVPFLKVARLMLYSLPGIVAQSAPFATLVGFLMCVGRMATDNEILILRASGIRYSFIAVPVMLLGLFISFAGFAMNDYFLPLGLLKFNRLKKQIVQSDPAVEIEANSVKRMNGTTLVIGGVGDDGIIEDLVIFDKDATGRDRVIMTGRSEVNKSDEAGILMQFNMSGATVLEVDRAQGKNFDVFESQRILLNVFDSVLMPSTGVQPREMTSFDLWKIIQVMKKDSSVTHKMMNRYNLEFAKKFSMPFGSIFFAILAFPLALIFGKRDGQTLGMIFGIIISVIYWAATILGQIFGVRSGWNGFWMMWGPNFFIGVVGLLLYFALRKR